MLWEISGRGILRPIPEGYRCGPEGDFCRRDLNPEDATLRPGRRELSPLSIWDMGAYDSSKSKEISYGREVRSSWSGAGDGVGNLTERIGSMGISDSPMDGLIQVIRAVEDAENQIKQQVRLSQFGGVASVCRIFQFFYNCGHSWTLGRLKELFGFQYV